MNRGSGRRAIPASVWPRIVLLVCAAAMFVWLMSLMGLLSRASSSGTPPPSTAGTAAPAVPSAPSTKSRLAGADPWESVNSADMRLWCSTHPHAHACRARNMCLIQGSKSLPDGWYLPYTDAESKLLWTPEYNSRSAPDPLDSPVSDRLMGSDDPRQDHGPLKEFPFFRVRTACQRGAACLPGIQRVLNFPGSTWILDWELALRMPTHVSHFLRPVLAMYAARNVSTAGFVPRKFDRVVMPARAGLLTKYQNGLLQMSGSFPVPTHDANNRVILPSSAQEAVGLPVVLKEHVDWLFESQPGTALCFENAYMAFEEFYFNNQEVCPAMRNEVDMRLGGAADACPPSKVVYVQRLATDGEPRSIANEAEVLAALGALTEYTVFTPNSGMTFEEQVRGFSDAGIVISVHGSQNANAIWMPAGSVFIELFPWNFYHDLMTTVLNRCQIVTTPIRTNTVEEKLLNAKQLDDYDLVQRQCKGLSDIDCFWYSGATRDITRALPTHVNIADFQATVKRALASVGAVRRECLGKRQNLLQPFIPRRDVVSAAAEYASHLENKFTVYLSTFDRDGLLRKVVAHYAQSPLIDRILISWNNVDREPPTAESFKSPVPLHIIREKDTSMNNRFRPHPELIRTRAVFNVDDDILVPLDDLAFGFSIWQQFPDQLVGFLARTHTTAPTFPYRCDTPTDGLRLYYSADCKSDGTGGDKTFWSPKYTSHSMVLDSACIFDVMYLDMYTNHMPAEVRKMVDDTRNCEDIALPMLLSDHAGKPGIYVQSEDLQHLQDENEKGHHPGLNKLTGHYEERTDCITDMSRMFGYPAGKTPLLYSNFKLLPVRHNEV